MQKTIFIAAMGMIALSMTAPARADTIADQSRISVYAPIAPGLEQGILILKHGMLHTL